MSTLSSLKSLATAEQNLLQVIGIATQRVEQIAGERLDEAMHGLEQAIAGAHLRIAEAYSRVAEMAGGMLDDLNGLANELLDALPAELPARIEPAPTVAQLDARPLPAPTPPVEDPEADSEGGETDAVNDTVQGLERNFGQPINPNEEATGAEVPVSAGKGGNRRSKRRKAG